MKSSLKFFIVLLLSFVFVAGQAQTSVHKYINKYQDLAVSQMKKFQIPASVIMGVSIIESGAGTSKLAKVFHNHFGVKGSSTDSKQKLGYKSAYKEYASDTSSFDHFCMILQKKKFYDRIKGDPNYSIWLQSMNKANYSEAKDAWVRKITATIKKYKLYELDEL